MNIRKATLEDIEQIGMIYSRIHEEIESGREKIGWIRDIYPVEKTALDALERGDLFVAENEGRVAASAIINQIQVFEYRNARWQHNVSEEQIMVLHTLAVDPLLQGRGYGRAFVEFYESYAEQHKCVELRMDTNFINHKAREMYRKFGYEEIDTVPCVFNGIPDVRLVCLEKYLDNPEVRKT